MNGLNHRLSSVSILISLLSIMLTFASVNTRAQMDRQQQEIVELPSSRLRLVVFSGSDWCLPCIRFERSVLHETSFVEFSDNHLIIEIADFPQHKKLSKAQVQYNEQLAEKYNPQGYFPHVLLLDRAGKVLTQIYTNNADAENVISQIKAYLRPAKMKEFSTSLILMGSAFKITIVAEEGSGDIYLAEAINEIQQIESWLSSWQDGSITTRLNNEGGINPVKVPEEYYQLVKRALELSKLTQGAFDISFNGLGNLYIFDQQEHELPTDMAINNKLQHVGYNKIVLHDNQYISFSDSMVQIGFGAIGKGYAAEQVKKLMQDRGVPGGVVNASGDLTTWGTRANGEAWKVGIPAPNNKDNIIMWLPVEEMAVATSGDYEKYFTNQGQRFSHIINPKTGLPVVGVSSVSIISDSAELSDALATAVSVLGIEVGMNLINQLEGVECVFIDNNLKLHLSSGLKANAY